MNVTCSEVKQSLDHPSRLRILVLSDVHFGGSWVGDFMPPGSGEKLKLTNSVSMREHLIKVLSGTKIDCIFVAGDLTETGRPQHFELCRKVLFEIAKAIGVNDSDVYMTFGNHDFDWDIARLGEKHDPADKGYDRIAGSIGPMRVGASVKSDGPIPGCGIHETERMVLYVLNSGFYSTPALKYQHGFLGNDQLRWFRENLQEQQKSNGSGGKWKVLLVHHHPFNYTYPRPVEDISCLTEGAELVEAAGRFGVDLICHGHRHQPRLFTGMRTGWRTPVTFFCAGSLAVKPDVRAMGDIKSLMQRGLPSVCGSPSIASPRKAIARYRW